MRYLAPGEDAGRAGRRGRSCAGSPRRRAWTSTPSSSSGTLHRSVVTHGSPTARGGGLAGRPGIDALGLPGVLIAGDWVGPTG